MSEISVFKSLENDKKRMRKILIILAILLIFFGGCLIANGGYGLYKNQTMHVYIDTPQITGKKSGSNIVLNISSNIGIRTIKHSWNDGVSEEMSYSGDKNIEIEYPMPVTGTNELNIEIVDSKGDYIKYDPILVYCTEDDVQEQSQSSNETNGESIDNTEDTQDNTNSSSSDNSISSDTTKPEITVKSNENGKITITAVDDVMMESVVYDWNGEDEQKATGLSEDQKTITIDMEVLKGSNTLNVKAYDKAGNESTYSTEIQGARTDIDIKKDGSKIRVVVSDDAGITKIVYNLNGEEKTIDNINALTYEFTVDMVSGENKIIVDAYAKSNGNTERKTEKKGKTQY